MKQTEKKRLRIATIRSAGSKNGLPGNLLINSTPDKPNWFSRREWRNQLIGAGLSPDIILPAFVGATINYEVLTVTQADIDAGGGVYKHTVGGREIEYKKPGVHNINLEIDFSTVNVTESTKNLAGLSQLYPDRRTIQAPQPQQTRKTAEETLEDEGAPTENQPVENNEQLAENQPVDGAETNVEHENLAEN